jgi:hypothetical protein
MAIEKLSSPSNPPSSNLDWGYAVTLIEKAFLNEENGIRIDYDNDLVLKGSVFQVGGSVYITTGDTSITGSSSDYVKLTVSGSSLVPSYVANLSGVTWNSTYRGYYDGSGNLYVFDEMHAYFIEEISDVNKITGNNAKRIIDDLNKIMKVNYVGANGGNTVATTWTALSFNTDVYNYITGASRSSNQIILPAGKYIIDGFFYVYGGGGLGNGADGRWRNITDGTNEPGVSCSSGSASSTGGTFLKLSGYFEITSQKTFEFQYYASAATTNGLGNGAFSGNQEFRAIMINKVGF